jgi:hypothetical protein
LLYFRSESTKKVLISSSFIFFFFLFEKNAKKVDALPVHSFSDDEIQNFDFKNSKYFFASGSLAIAIGLGLILIKFSRKN